MIPSIYSYSEPRGYLRDVLTYKKSRNRLFSIRAWSQQMGFPCHTSLVFLLNGKRRVRPEHVDKLNRSLRLGVEEEKYLRLLVSRENAKTDGERADIDSRLSLLRPSSEQSLLNEEKFHFISDWLHMAILEMTELSGFRFEAAWIARRLGGTVTTPQVEEALQRLLQLGLLKKTGNTLTKTNEHLTTPGDRSSEAIREHHKQVLALAARAVDEQSVHERVLNASAFTIDSSRLGEAKEIILKFRADMAKLLEKKGGDETYELSVQLFKLTKNRASEIQ
ncbi:MAG: TIGR02147 family protein [Bdellovibrionota bacterium]